MVIAVGVLAALFSACAVNYFLFYDNTMAGLVCSGIAVVCAIGFVISRTLDKIESSLNDVRRQLRPRQRAGRRAGRDRRNKKMPD